MSNDSATHAQIRLKWKQYNHLNSGEKEAQWWDEPSLLAQQPRCQSTLKLLEQILKEIHFKKEILHSMKTFLFYF